MLGKCHPHSSLRRKDLFYDARITLNFLVFAHAQIAAHTNETGCVRVSIPRLTEEQNQEDCHTTPNNHSVKRFFPDSPKNMICVIEKPWFSEKRKGNGLLGCATVPCQRQRRPESRSAAFGNRARQSRGSRHDRKDSIALGCCF